MRLASPRALARRADYPEDFGYNVATQELRVGTGRFGAARPEDWDFSVSSLQVVDSWLSLRRRRPAGRSSAPLDLLWVLDHTVDRLPRAAGLLDRVLARKLFQAGEPPQPGASERHGPGAKGEAAELCFAGFGARETEQSRE